MPDEERRLRRLACLLFGCNFFPVEIWSAPPKRMVLFCSRCRSLTTVTPGRELSYQMAKEHAQRAAHAGAPWLN